MALIGTLIDFTPNTTIVSADVDANFSTIKTAFNTSAVLTDVAVTIAVTHTFSAAQRFAAGTVSAPGIYLSSDTNSGLYQIAGDNWGVAMGGAKVLDIATAGLAVTGTLSASSTLAVTGAATLSSTLAVTGVTTLAGALVTDAIRRGTSDGADNSRVLITGGGAVDDSGRGATIIAHGNEHANTGKLDFHAGNVSGGTMRFYTGAGTERLSISDAGAIAITGSLTVSTTLAVTGAATLSSTLAVTGVTTLTGDVIASVIRRATSDGADNSRLFLAGGGATDDVGRGAGIIIQGNEHANTGQLQMFAGNVSAGHILFYTGAFAERLRISDAGAVSITGTLAVSSTSSFTGNATFSGNVTVSGTLTANLGAITATSLNLGGATITDILTGTGNFDTIGNISAGGEASVDVTVTGAAVGDVAIVSQYNAASSQLQSAEVTSANTVRVYWHNQSSTSHDPATGLTFRVFVIKV